MEEIKDINRRIKQLRETIGYTQEELGNVIGINRSGISNIEKGIREVTNQHIRLLCSWDKYRINESWLRTGEGEMFVTVSPSDELASYCKDICMGKSKLLESIIIEFMKLDDESQKTVEKLFLAVAERMHQ